MYKVSGCPETSLVDSWNISWATFRVSRCKIQGCDFSLSNAEKKKVSLFLIDSAAAENEDDSEDESLGEFSFLDKTLGSAAVKSAKRQKNACPYRPNVEYRWAPLQ